MKVFIYTLSLFLAIDVIDATGIVPPRCSKPYEVWSPCDCHPCRPKCDQPDVICTYVVSCYPGCVCAEGYLRDAQGNCVPKDRCVAKWCPRLNEEYQSCGTACPLTCLNKDDNNTICTDNCVPGCFCKSGYVRDELQNCILPSDCKNTRCDDKNAERVVCPNPCPGGTCEYPDFIPCDAPCPPSGCQCKPGYVKDNRQLCILVGDCPNRKCYGPNEVYKTCGTACPENCKEMNLPCTDQCVAGCFCDDGYIRDRPGGRCIKMTDCPLPTCKGKNEVYDTCGTACPKTCENLDKDIICTLQCVQGCFCKPGYVRKNGVCVRPIDCSCGRHELWSAHALEIQRTCALVGKPLPRSKRCPGCVCMEGYVRYNRYNGTCVKPINCKK